MKAIHNCQTLRMIYQIVVLYLKDTQKWKQFTTSLLSFVNIILLCYISKILKNESNSQHNVSLEFLNLSCVISQRYSKMKAIHNELLEAGKVTDVVLYLKDTQKWKQFTTGAVKLETDAQLCYISKILKNESNSQYIFHLFSIAGSCVISQRYSKMKAIHNSAIKNMFASFVVLYLKDTQKWKQFTTKG